MNQKLITSNDADIAISSRGVGKQYMLGGAEQHYDTFRDLLASILTSPLKKFRKLSGQQQDSLFWALRDINFEIPVGQVTGVIGRNGAGKSTLLKVLSRITTPTTGELAIRGRVASLLEIGSGFHPELTGRENIYMNGSILGMSRTDIHQKLDEIVAFAEVERFLDTPVKRYSSGMYVRLAFSVAAHVDPDVLLVDEVLAVGDAKFQKRCIGKLSEVGKQGRTVVFVSHNMGLVSELCSHIIYLENGHVESYGEAGETIGHYMSKNNNSNGQWISADSHSCLKGITVKTPDKGLTSYVDYNEEIQIEFTLTANYLIEDCILELLVTDMFGRDVLLSFDRDAALSEVVLIGSSYKATCTLPKSLLKPGQYQGKASYRGLKHSFTEILEEMVFDFEVSEVGFNMQKRNEGIVGPRLNWSISHD